MGAQARAIETTPDITQYIDVYELKEAALIKSDHCSRCDYLFVDHASTFDPGSNDCNALEAECPIASNALALAEQILEPTTLDDEVEIVKYLAHVYHPDFNEYTALEKEKTVINISNRINSFKPSCSFDTLPIISVQLQSFLIKQIESNLVKVI